MYFKRKERNKCLVCKHSFQTRQTVPKRPRRHNPQRFPCRYIQKSDPKPLFIEISSLDKAVDLLPRKLIIILFVTLIK